MIRPWYALVVEVGLILSVLATLAVGLAYLIKYTVFLGSQ